VYYTLCNIWITRVKTTKHSTHLQLLLSLWMMCLFLWLRFMVVVNRLALLSLVVTSIFSSLLVNVLCTVFQRHLLSVRTTALLKATFQTCSTRCWTTIPVRYLLSILQIRYKLYNRIAIDTLLLFLLKIARFLASWFGRRPGWYLRGGACPGHWTSASPSLEFS